MTVTTQFEEPVKEESISEVAAASDKAAEKWSLHACSSWLAGQDFSIRSKTNADVIKVGRGSHCDIIFPGTHLSREHVELRIEHEQIHVKDLRSINGTFINEVRVSEGVVRPGDKLRLDVYSFTVNGPKIKEPIVAVLRDDTNATKLREANKPLTKAKTDLPEKKWITKPTSPGNRIEEPPAPAKPNVQMWMVYAALILAASMIGAVLIFS